MLHEPAPSLPTEWARRPARPSEASARQNTRAAIVGVLTLAAVAATAVTPAVLLIPLALGCYWFLPPLISQLSAARPSDEWQQQRIAARQRFDSDTTIWQHAIDEDEDRERERVAGADVWFPLCLHNAADRVDVVGGVIDGWRHLLVTVCAPAVAQRRPVLLLDMTGERVANGLVELAHRVGSVAEVDVSGGGQTVDLLAGLTADEVAEVLADSVESLRGVADPATRTTDADLLRAVSRRLNGNLTPPRLAAGIRVLQRSHEEGMELTLEEVTALTAQVDVVAGGERARDQLGLLRVALDLLTDTTRRGASPTTPEALLQSSGFTVVTTDHPSPTRKDFAERLLFESLLQCLRRRRDSVSGQTLIVVGADHLRIAGLEAMAKQARSHDVRLIYFFEHLRDDTQRLLGSSQSAAMIMRLGNAAQAAAAAEHIGRGHSLKLGQITRQLGSTDTVGGGESVGRSTATTVSQQASSGRSGLSYSSSSGSSFSESISHSSQQMRNWSRATSFTDGTTEQRVYEFNVEPTTIQALPASALILVEGGAQGRRVAAADCNPAIAGQDRVAARPVAAR